MTRHRGAEHAADGVRPPASIVPTSWIRAGYRWRALWRPKDAWRDAWPAGVGFDEACARCAVDASRDPDVVARLDARWPPVGIGDPMRRDHLPILALYALAFVWFFAAMAIAGHVGYPWQTALLALPSGFIFGRAFTIKQRRIDAPRQRAVLRGVGVSVCIECGHAIGTSAVDDACPECGRRHDDFPIGWTKACVLDPRAEIERRAESDDDASDHGPRGRLRDGTRP